MRRTGTRRSRALFRPLSAREIATANRGIRSRASPLHASLPRSAHSAPAQRRPRAPRDARRADRHRAPSPTASQGCPLIGERRRVRVERRNRLATFSGVRNFRWLSSRCEYAQTRAHFSTPWASTSCFHAAANCRRGAKRARAVDPLMGIGDRRQPRLALLAAPVPARRRVRGPRSEISIGGLAQVSRVTRDGLARIGRESGELIAESRPTGLIDLLVLRPVYDFTRRAFPDWSSDGG